ncbi:hypothetical protein PENSPDRAFT_652706 [Peniophora sp. CONT]|nr:hypothetical protein PENSPDRAFT_652706 [Peniophora sp. CONT]
MLGHRPSEPLFPMLECIRIAGLRIADSEVNIFELDLTPMLYKTYEDREIRFELRRCIITQTSLERIKDILHPWPVLDDGYSPPPSPADPRLALRTLALGRI